MCVTLEYHIIDFFSKTQYLSNSYLRYLRLWRHRIHTVYEAYLSLHYPLMWNATQEYTITYCNVLGQTQPRNPSSTFHRQSFMVLFWWYSIRGLLDKIYMKCFSFRNLWLDNKEPLNYLEATLAKYVMYWTIMSYAFACDSKVTLFLLWFWLHAIMKAPL